MQSPSTTPGQHQPVDLPPRVMIISQPKSGTYFLSEILKNMGLRQTFLHFSMDHFEAYDPNRLDEGKAGPKPFRIICPIQESAKIIRTGEFGVGHLPHEPRSVDALRGFALICLRRNMRDTFLSLMRFMGEGRRSQSADETWYESRDTAAFIRANAAWLHKSIRSITPWLECPGVMTLSYEDLREHTDRCARKIATHLNVPCDDFHMVAEKSLDAPTLTKSMKLYDPQWSPEAEEAFQEVGGVAINQLLGYHDEAE